MAKNVRVHFVLPVYNESKGIYNLLERIGQLDQLIEQSVSVIVVNDCSSDDSVDWINKAIADFDKLTIKLIHHDQNKGLGGALVTMFEAVAEQIDVGDIVVSMDGDDTHPVFLVREMMERIWQGADIVIGSRYCEASRIAGLSTLRIFLSHGARCVYTLRWRLPGVRDYTCLFRAHNYSIASWLGKNARSVVTDNGFTATTQLLVAAVRQADLITEAPMMLRYDHKVGGSNMQLLRTIISSLKMVVFGRT